MNKVINGVNEMSLNFDGKTVAQVAATCKSLLNLSGDEVLRVNGAEASADYLIEDGDDIEFTKNAGVKGAETISVTVSAGVNTTNIVVNDGSTVQEVLRKAASIINAELGAGTSVKVNNVDSSLSERVEDGDNVEVVRSAGSKG